MSKSQLFRRLSLALFVAVATLGVGSLAARAEGDVEFDVRVVRRAGHEVERAPTRVVLSRRRVLARLEAALEGLDRARELALPGRRHYVDHELVEELERTHDRLVRLQRHVADAPELVERVVVEEVVEVEPPLLAEPDFLAFLRQLRRAGFDDDRLILLDEVVREYAFTTSQVVEILGEFRFSKVDAAVVLYPVVVDPGRYVLVYDELTFPSDRRELKRRLDDLR